MNKSSLYSLKSLFRSSELPVEEPVCNIDPRTLTQKQLDTYRFGGERYSFKSVSGKHPSAAIPQVDGLYAFPKGEEDPMFPAKNDSNTSSNTSSASI